MNREPNFRQNKVRFDWTITAGNLMTLAAGVIAMCGAYVDYRLTSDRHEIRITNNEIAVTALKQTVADQYRAQIETTRSIDRLTSIIEQQNRHVNQQDH